MLSVVLAGKAHQAAAMRNAKVSAALGEMFGQYAIRGGGRTLHGFARAALRAPLRRAKLHQGASITPTAVPGTLPHEH